MKHPQPGKRGGWKLPWRSCQATSDTHRDLAARSGPSPSTLPLWGLSVAVSALAVAAYQSVIFAVLDGLPIWNAELGPGYFAVNVAVVLALSAFGHSLIGRWLPAQVLVHGGITILVLAHLGKMLTLNRPLYLTDLTSAAQVVSLLPVLVRTFPGLFAALAVLVLGIVLGLVLAFRHPVWKARSRQRLLAGAFATLVIGPLVAWTHLVPRGSNLDTALRAELWGGRDYFVHKGFVLASLLQLSLRIPSPKAYDLASVEAALRRAGLALGTEPGRPETLPDIVLYLAEAVWDPTVLPVRFDRDPAPNLRRLLAGPVAGDMRVPVFGGLTPQTEFEVLTGLSTDYFPMGTVVYQRYLHRPVPALPAYLRQLGYHPAAVHTNHGWFWDRARVYPLLGFERFITLDDFDRPPRAGAFVSDIALVDRVISECEAASPCLVFAISMASHGPYDRALPADQPVNVVSGLGGAPKAALEGYATALAHADLALGRLIDRLGRWPRPIVVAVFGDHLPLLGPGFKVYRETGFRAKPPTSEEQERMHTTPVFVWSNRPLPTERLHCRASAFGAHLLRAAGLPLPLAFAFADHVDTVAPTPATVPGQLQADWWLLHHDLVLGSQYLASLDPLLGTAWRQLARLRADHELDLAGRPTIEITDFAPRTLSVGEEHLPQPDGSSAMWVRSRSTSGQAQIVLDGVRLPTQVGPDGLLTAKIPPRVLRSAGRHSVAVVDPVTRSRSAERELLVVDPVLPPTAEATGLSSVTPSLAEWGPTCVDEDVPFNQQPDGSSAFWFRLENPPASVAVHLDGVRIPSATGAGGLVSATTRPLASGRHRLSLIDTATGLAFAEVWLEVRQRPPVG